MQHKTSHFIKIIINITFLTSYPFLYFFNYNIDQVSLLEIIYPFLTILVITLIIFSIFSKKGIFKSHVLTSLFLIFILVYGHIRYFIPFFPEKLFFILYLISFSWLIRYIYLSKNDFKIMSNFLMSFISILFLMNVSILLYNYEPNDYFERDISYDYPLQKQDKYYDIYYIMLDSYPSQDVLLRDYNFDNSDFYLKLEKLGFKINHNSLSNYGITFLSLLSLFNFDYIEKLLPIEKIKGSSSRILANELIKNNSLINLLKLHQYDYMHISSGWGPTNKNRYATQVIDNNGFGNEIVIKILENTFFYPIMHRLGYTLDLVRNKVMKNYDDLSGFLSTENNKFIFLHSYPPHPPYIFNEEGEKFDDIKTLEWGNNNWKKKDHYVRQLQYVNKMLLKSLEKVINNSDNPAIIVIQGDHGPRSAIALKSLNILQLDDEENKKGLQENFRVLNAIYTPKDISSFNKKNFSIVNTFRILLNEYFGLKLNILEDKSFISTHEDPYNLKEITELVKY